jgi:beta-galactosidase
VLLRSTPMAGKIVVRASAAGLQSATLELESQAVVGDSLPSYLARGPTPATPSFKVSRRTVEIVGVAAGSNAADAGKSFDDDETTSWVSEAGQTWITYRLGRTATLTEASLKLAGWRQRSYPIRISVDGQEVFKGDTPKGLGYVTLPLKPVNGNTVKIELTGVASDNDAIKLIEVANQATVDTGADRTSKGVLAIVEAEFYEPISDSIKASHR